MRYDNNLLSLRWIASNVKESIKAYLVDEREKEKLTIAIKLL
jgi:hypothetical protein